MEDRDPRIIEHDPEEFSPKPPVSYVTPGYVIGLAATLFGIYVVNFGIPNTDPLDMGAFVAFGLFCLWNYWPKR